jgi:RasGEF domain
VGALQSEVISRLDLTHKAMSHKEQRRLQKLGTLVTPESNYGTYRAAVQRDDKRGCIPWHSKHFKSFTSGWTDFSKFIDVHLHDIAIVLQEEDVEEHHEAPLINFQKWAHLKEKALDAMRYRGIRLEYDENGLEMAMAYLTQQFQPVAINDDFSRLLQTKSARLRQSEDAIRRDTVIRSVGFG